MFQECCFDRSMRGLSSTMVLQGGKNQTFLHQRHSFILVCNASLNIVGKTHVIGQHNAFNETHSKGMPLTKDILNDLTTSSPLCRRRTNVQQLTCNIDLSNYFYYLLFSFVLIELKPFVLKGKVLGEKF